MKLVLRTILWSVLFLIALPVAAGAVVGLARGWPPSWHAADWSSSGLLADAQDNREAAIIIYAARSGRWKGIFAVHHWIVVKPERAPAYTRYDVVGWGNPVRRNGYAPDARWYGNVPAAIFTLRGPAAARLIPKIEAAVESYPWSGRGMYRAWPGPNSNSFVAHVLRQVPELEAEMLPTGVGKDFLGPGLRLAPTPSGSGWQVSLWGLAGGALAWREGLEFHVLGATIGIDPDDLAVSLPALGKFGLRAARQEL